MLVKFQKGSKYFYCKCKICNTQLRHYGKKKPNLAKVLGQMVRISQKFIIIYVKNMLKNTTL